MSNESVAKENISVIMYRSGAQKCLMGFCLHRILLA